MTYAKVINGEIVENNRTLPFSTDNTSFGINTSIDTMKEFGYLPIIGSEPTLTVNQRVNGVSYVVGADEVTKVYDVVVISDEELYKATVPTSLKMAQCRAQLIIDGKDDDVEALIDSTEDLVKKKLYRAYWEYEPLVLRDNAMINEMAPLLNIDLDTFFINAGKL